ncbi:hypothetical protein ACTHPH_18740 [Paenibacillus pasadenensis]|uniref:Uncharacterized protein n=1 Tax=Paenibacillus pasadenensis TaxID=217090 RepID=A0A2N5N6I7_9BACL|nr:hypothetical protein [Paenibacillus pasadenensis]PLT45920.1 hypothetical protein B8V81_4351 [Paenibacillus pasadenensis]
MAATKLARAFALTLGVAAANVAVFSPGLMNVRFGGSAFSSALGAAVLAASGLALLYGAYALLQRPPAPAAPAKLETVEHYAAALGAFRRVRTVAAELELALEQLDRMEKRKQSLHRLLAQRFEPEELSYRKFSGVILEVEELFRRNLRAVLSRLALYEQTEAELKSGSRSLSRDLQQRRLELIREQHEFLKATLGHNEEILLKLNQLLLELTRLDQQHPGTIDELPGMQELDALIRSTKYYA